MYFKVSFDQDFDDLMFHLWSKYGKELFNLDGIGKQTDMKVFADNFFNDQSNTADKSVDSNSNITNKDIITYTAEFPKPFQKYNSYYLLWKQLLNEYNLETANDIIEKQLTGSIYINDFTDVSKPYCFNYTCMDIVFQGLPMIQKIKSVPPKHLYSFKSQLEQFVTYASNSTLGATGIADLFVCMSYYIQKILCTGNDAGFNFVTEDDIWRYVKENIVSFIYTINQPTRGGIQSAFTNVSIFDDYFLDSLLDEYIFPDGEKVEKSIVKKVQDIFLETMNEELSRTPVTFPVTTACFSIDENREIQDREFAYKIAKFNKDFGFINIYFGDTSTLSSCCFSGDQKVIIKSSNGIHHLTFKELADFSYDDTRWNLTVYHNGSWKQCKLVILPKNDKKMYKIVTSNNKELFVTNDHIHSTNRGDIKTDELTTDDFLAFSSRQLDSFSEKCSNYTYEQGYLIGAYLGDGSIYKRFDCESYTVTFSLNSEKINKCLSNIKQGLTDFEISEKINNTVDNNNVEFLNIYSKKLFNIIKYFVKGFYSYEKYLNMDILLESYDFRKGICDGWYDTDGGNSNRIYTTSKELSEQAEVLFNSIGFNTIINISDRTDEKVVLCNQEYDRNYSLYCIKWYSMTNKGTMEDTFRVFNNTEYFKIKYIEEVQDYLDDKIYCFEMKDQSEPYFTLPNGVITHNCRLRSDTNNEYFNSFGAGSSKIGSLGVVTLNLARLAREIKPNFNKFLEKLREYVHITGKVNNAKRNIIKTRINQGVMPLYNYGFMELSKQYSTTGLNGLNEVCEIFGTDICSEEGTDMILKIMNVLNEETDGLQEYYKAPHNLEQTPSENSAIKLAKKDTYLQKNPEEYTFYSNQFIPLITDANLLDRLHLQGLFDKHFSGGSIAHINVEQQIEEESKIVNLIESCSKLGIVYFAINYNLQECEKSHISIGKREECPKCGSPIINNFTRVVGFLTNVDSWAKERRQEDYPNRQFY